MPAVAEKTVYTSTSHEPGERVTYPIGLGVRCRQTSLGGRYRIELGWGNQWRLLMNDRLPVDKTGQLIAHPQDGVCSACGYIYSHLMRNAGQPCDECKAEELAQKQLDLYNAWDIDLGLANTRPLSDSAMYAKVQHRRTKAAGGMRWC